MLCVIDIYSKYAWVVPFKEKKGLSIVNAFQSILKKSNRKPNKIWVDKGSEFCNSHFKKWLKDNDIEMYSTHIERKSVVTEGFIRTIKIIRALEILIVGAFHEKELQKINKNLE